MSHVIAFANLCTCLKSLGMLSFALLKWAWTFQGDWSLTHQENLWIYSKKGLQNGCFNEKFPKIFIKIIFWNANEWCSKNSSNIFSRTQMDVSEWMKKKIIRKCLDNLVDFQMAFKMCRKTIAIIWHKS